MRNLIFSENNGKPLFCPCVYIVYKISTFSIIEQTRLHRIPISISPSSSVLVASETLKLLNRSIVIVTIIFGVAGPIVTARAVLQGTAELPCDIRPPRQNDSAILVVWYKSDITPIYR